MGNNDRHLVRTASLWRSGSVKIKMPCDPEGKITRAEYWQLSHYLAYFTHAICLGTRNADYIIMNEKQYEGGNKWQRNR